MKYRIVFKTLIVLAVIALSAPLAQADGSVGAGKKKAVACQVCHGHGGNSTNPLYPVLAGQHAKYIAKQLHAFREGTRSDPVMNGMAKPLTDQDIEDLAAYFQSNR